MPYADPLKRREYQQGYRQRSVAPEYRSWRAMKARCLNPKTDGYEKYGAVGVKICARWLNSFQDFLSDMERKPTPKHTIDRIDAALGYFPENCRWATVREQIDNRRDRIRILFNGVELYIEEWAVRVGMKRDTLWARIKRQGWSPERALTTPIR